jgi:hypothetical protein
VAREFDTQIGLTVKDNATPKIRSVSEEMRRMQSAREALGVRSEQAIQREIARTQAAYNRLERSGKLSSTELAMAAKQTAASITRLQGELGTVAESYQRVNRMQSARETLGIRSEHSIQREIARTQAAYNRMVRSGDLSAREQSRAWQQTQATIARLRSELGQTERAYQRIARVGGTVMKTAGIVGGGVVAGAMAMRKPVENQVQYDAELRKVANFAYKHDNLAGRQAGMNDIDAAIRTSLRTGGGDVNGAFHALEVMLRSGTMNRTQAYKALPGVVRNATATETDPAAVASLQSSAYNFGLNDKDARAGLSVTTTMSQSGMVDSALLAKEMPKALESAKTLGLHGRTGFSQVAALFEAAARGAGSPEEAATFTTNLLSELSSPTLASNFKQAKIGKRGIDIRSLIRADAEKGLTPLDTVDRAIRAIDEHDPQYAALSRQIEATAPGEKRDQLEARRDQIHGQNVGRIFTNEYSRMGYLNWERNKGYYQDLIKEGNAQFDMPEGKTSADLDFDLVKDSPQYQLNKAKNESLFAANDTAKPLATSLGDAADKASVLAQEFPKLTTAITGAYSAFQSLGAMGGAGVGALVVAGGKKVVNKIRGGGSAAGEVVGEAAETVAKSSSILAKPLKVLSPVGDVIMAGDMAYSQYIERGRDKVAASGGKVPDYMPQPAGLLDAFDEMRRFFSESNKPTPGAASTAPAQNGGQRNPELPSISIYMDSREVTAQVMRRAELNERRK